MANATRARIKTGFAVSCPMCGASGAIHVDLNDVHTCTCEDCGDSFAPETARAKVAAELARWDRVVRWIELAGDVLAE